MFPAKFLDGTPVPPEYEAAVSAMIRDTCEAQEIFTLDELEAATTPCPGGCDHTDAEHRAFDAGVAAGRAGLEGWESLYQGNLREAYLTGWSVGALDRSQRGEVE